MAKEVQDLDELEQAIHYLKEAQQLDTDDEYVPIVADARLDMINKAMDSIIEHMEEEKERVPFKVNPGP